MPKHNADIAAIFEEIADLLEIQGSNPFRIRAYRNAARVVSELPEELSHLIERGGGVAARRRAVIPRYFAAPRWRLVLARRTW